ncbi:hypothetical protein ACHAQH_010007 [Verticillium albo-atrum]
MRLTLWATLSAAVAVAAQSTSLGFTTYKEIREGSDNSDAIRYYELNRSNSLFLYVQIIAGQDHSDLIQDFKTLCRNYGAAGVSVIPRVRYGDAAGNFVTEPDDVHQVLTDVLTWGKVFSEASASIDMPVVQAGFLGLWGEWHSGPLSENLKVKDAIVTNLMAFGLNVAIRYPRDHMALFGGDRTVTIHNDCIFNGGPDGYDGGSFPASDRQAWVDYTKQIASGNIYGGEPCNQAGDSTYDWEDYDDLCGPNGLAAYIDEFRIAYLNPGNPEALWELVYNSDRTECVNEIEAALLRHQ